MTTMAQGSGGLQDRLLQVLLAAGSGWVLYLLLGLSVISLAVAIERVGHFWRRGGGAAAVAARLAQSLAAGDLAAAQRGLEDDRSHAAAVARRGLATLGRGPVAVAEEIAAATVGARLAMERGVAFLGTLGNNAPFIGLFGTVLGIMRAFGDLADAGAGGASQVMAGIAEALVTTAIGIAVALPAVALYNVFQRRTRVELAHIDAVGHLLRGHAAAPAG